MVYSIIESCCKPCTYGKASSVFFIVKLNFYIVTASFEDYRIRVGDCFHALNLVAYRILIGNTCEPCSKLLYILLICSDVSTKNFVEVNMEISPHNRCGRQSRRKHRSISYTARFNVYCSVLLLSSRILDTRRMRFRIYSTNDSMRVCYGEYQNFPRAQLK